MTTGESSEPVLSVVVPAAQEEDHILPCLEAVLAQRGLNRGAIEVIVAANGCTDRTVARARGMVDAFALQGWRLTVLDLPEGGKVGALNRADAEARAPARAYLDADVVIDADLLSSTISALARPQPVYATGRMRVARARSWVSRRYGALWVRLPFMAPGTAPGAGFFAVNAAGRARWNTFPAVIADDSFVRWLFSSGERVEVAAGYTWPLVEGFSGLVRVRRRQDAGGVELSRLYPNLERNEEKSQVTVRTHLTLMTSRPLDYGVYVAVKLATRIKRDKTASWARGTR